MFIKECRAITKSIIYFAFLFVVLLFYTTQFGDAAAHDMKQFSTREVDPWRPLSGNPLIAPTPGQDNYGYRNAEIPAQVMPNATAKLYEEYSANGFVSYATGFGRVIKLSKNQLAEIENMLFQMTGLSADELRMIRNEKAMSDDVILIGLSHYDYSDVIPILISYDEFKTNMEYIDKMVGGSYYDPANLKQYGQTTVTYEEKLAEHNDFLYKDKITGTYARLFSDYMGIILALFSIFVPVSFLLRDRRAKMNELIFSRGKSSANIVLTRYFALVFMTILPILLLSLIPTVQLSIFAANQGFVIDYFAFLKYIMTWLLPTVLTTTAVAYFFTTLTDTPVAILLQLVWSFVGLFAGTYTLEGGHYGIEIVIRHNSLGNLHLVQENINALLINRLSYTAVSMILIFVSVYLYHLKRRGKLNVRNR